MKMPFRSLAFLASITVVTHITGASKTARPLTKDVNRTDSDPLSFADLSDAPANNVSSTHNTTVNEERMAGRGAPLLRSGVMKTVLFELYGASKNMLTPTGQKAVISADEKILSRVELLKSKAHVADKKAIFPGGSQKLAMEPLIKLIKVSEEQYYANRLKTMKNNIVKWMQDRPSHELVEVLKEQMFFESFSYADMYVLSVCLEEFNAERDTAYPLLGTLLEGFGGAAQYASFLSVARQSPITGSLAMQAQNTLLTNWRNAGLTIDQVAHKLELRWLFYRGITYENLDTFVQYVLQEYGQTCDFVLKVLEFLRRELGDVGVVRAIIQGKKAGGQSPALYLRDRYGDVNIGLEQEALETHNGYAEVFENRLVALWLEEEKTLNGVEGILKIVPMEDKPLAVAIEREDTQDILTKFLELLIMSDR
uniref:RxLR effector candidate protein n=2 Tax=Hyaloperonospora arabidopsidis (strain Emoy2) TaxID=559515 RepID=M4B292_HYAAE